MKVCTALPESDAHPPGHAAAPAGRFKSVIKPRRAIALLAIVGLTALVGAGSGSPVLSPGGGTTYTITDLPPLPTGCIYSEAFAVNDAGLVAGAGCDSQSLVAPTLWRVDSTGKVVTTALPELFPRGGRAEDINNLGQIVGYSATDCCGDWTAHAALWQADGTGAYLVHDLGALTGFTASEAHGVSDATSAGHVIVAGESQRSDFTFRATAWQLDTAGNILTVTDLEPNSTDSRAWGVNKNGQIVGASNLSGSEHAIVWQVDSLGSVVGRTDLGTLQTGTQSGANDINGLGQVAGAAATGKKNSCGRDISDAALWTNGTISDLGSLGNSSSTALAKNDAGIVVGAYASTAVRCSDFDSNHAFVWTAGVMRDLSSLVSSKTSWTLFNAHDINATGQIVGTGIVGSGKAREQHAYLARPK